MKKFNLTKSMLGRKLESTCSFINNGRQGKVRYWKDVDFKPGIAENIISVSDGYDTSLKFKGNESTIKKIKHENREKNKKNNDFRYMYMPFEKASYPSQEIQPKKLIPKLPKLPRNEIVPYRETNTNHGSNGSSGSLSHFIDSTRCEENQENVKKNIIFTKLPKPIGDHCINCGEVRPIFWIDQSNNNYCVTCKKKNEEVKNENIR